jgi:autotransporter-associated beta strand protein
MALSAFARWLKTILRQQRKQSPIRSKKSPRLDLEHLETRLTPAVKIWDGRLDSLTTPTGNATWMHGPNWVGDVAPTAGDDLVFPASTMMTTNVNNFPVGTNFASITISGNGYVLSGNRIVLGNPSVAGSGSIVTNSNASIATVSFDISLGGNPANRQFFTVTNSAARLTIAGRLSDQVGNTGVALAKDGQGTLVFSGNNSLFTGPITVEQGALNVQHMFALGDVEATNDILDRAHVTIVESGAQLQVENVIGAIPEHIILNGLGIANSGALRNIAGTNTWAGLVELDNHSALGANANSTLTITGAVSDLASGFNLQKEGFGEVVLAAANSYRGQTIINQGTLTISHNEALGAAGSLLNGTIVRANAVANGTLRILAPSAGFTVVGEVLVLNGGGHNNNGALFNSAGNSAWTGNVTIGSATPIGSDPTIAVAANSSLAIDGFVNSNNGAYDYVKEMSGKLILTANNAFGTGMTPFSGSILVANGSLNIRDSGALGISTAAAGTTVRDGARVELEIDLKADSVLGATSNPLSMRVPEPIYLEGLGGGFGAIYNVSGRNTWSGTIVVSDLFDASIGVDPDVPTIPAPLAVDPLRMPPNPAPSPASVSNSTLEAPANQLTITGNIIDDPLSIGFSGNLTKLLRGELVLPSANPNFTGSTFIDAGWITVSNNQALGPRLAGSDSIQNVITVNNNAALHLKANFNQTLALPYQFHLQGLGIPGDTFNPANGTLFTRFPWLSKGALVNLRGNNNITGLIELNGTAGIGAELIPQPPASAAPGNANLTISNTMSDAAGSVGSLVKLGSQRLFLTADGTYTGNVDIVEGVVRLQHDSGLGRPDANSGTGGTFIRQGAALELDLTVGSRNGGMTTGTQVSFETLHIQSTGYTGTASGGALLHPVTVLNGDHLWRGIVRLEPPANGSIAANSTYAIDVRGLSRLQLVGSISDTTTALGITKIGTGELVLGGRSSNYRGPTIISQGVVTAQTSNALGSPVSGTTVANGATLQLQGDITIAGENLTLQGAGSVRNEVQRITQNATSGNYSLTFGGFTTGPLPFNANVTTIQSALESLTSIGTGNVVVSGATNNFSLTFTGALANVNVSQTIINNVSLNAGAALTNVTLTEGAITPGWFAQGPSPVNLGITPGNLPTSGRINAIAVDPNDANTIFVAASGGGVWKTVNGGATWQPLLDSIPALSLGFQTMVVSSIAIAPTNSNVIYIGTGEDHNANDSYPGHGLYRSTDGGLTWTLLYDSTLTTIPTIGVPLEGTAVTGIAVDPLSSNNVFVSVSDRALNGSTGNAGVWRWVIAGTGTGGPAGTTNGRWTNLTANMTIDPATNGLFDANNTIAPNSGNFTLPTTGRFTDVAFLTIPGLLGGFPRRRLFMAYSGDPDTSISTDAALMTGVYWTDNFNSTPVAPNMPRWAPNDSNATTSPTTLVFGSLTDYTTTITDATYFPPVPATTIPALAGPGPAARFPLGAGNNIKLTTFGNTLWAKIDTPNGPQVLTTTTQVLPDLTTMLPVQIDGGDSWNLLADIPFNQSTPNFYPGNALYASMFEATSATDLYIGGDALVLRSNDGGTTIGGWSNITVGGSGAGPHIAQHGAAGQSLGRVLFAGDGGIFQYHQGNNTWNAINGNLEVSLLRSAGVHPTDPYVMYASSQANGIQSINGYTPINVNDWPWTLLDNGDGGAVVVDTLNPQNVYRIQRDFAAGTATLEKSTAGGAVGSWVTVPFSTSPLVLTQFVPSVQSALAIDSVNPSRVLTEGSVTYAPPFTTPFTVAGLYETIDGGNTWAVLDDTAVGIVAVATAVYQGVYANDPNFSAATVPDRGASTYDPDTIYYITATDFRVSKNHGASWQTRNPTAMGDHSALAVDPRNRDFVYVGSDDLTGSRRIQFSSDAGRNWNDVTFNLGPTGLNLPVTTILVDPRNVTPGTNRPDLYVGTNIGVFKLDWTSNTWSRFGAGMPNVRITQLLLNQDLSILTAATYGRGVFNINLSTPNYTAPGAFKAIAGSSVWTGPVTILGNTTISADGTQTYQDANSVAQLTILGSVSGTGNITKDGLGRVVFGGNNTFNGTVIVDNGVLAARNLFALGSLNNNTTVRVDAALEIQSNLNAGNITLNGNGFSFNEHHTGALRNSTNFNVLTGNIILGTGTPRTTTIAGDPASVPNRITIGVDSASQLTINGQIIDLGGNPVTLVKELTGKLVLPQVNTFGGAFYINQGIVDISGNMALGGSANGTFVSDGAQIQLSGNVTIANEPLTISGSGVVNTGALYSFAGNNTWAGPITLTSIPAFAPSSTPISAPFINVRNAADVLTLSGTIGQSGGAFGYNKIGPGTMVLTQNNTYTGNSTISAGSVHALANAALGPGGSTTVQANATLVLADPAGVGLTINNETLNLVGANVNASIPGGTLRVQSGNHTWNGTFNMTLPASSSPLLTYGARVNVDANQSVRVTRMNGTATNVRFEKHGLGNMSLTANSTNAGGNLLNAGVLQVEAALGNTTLNGGTLAGNGTLNRLLSNAPGGVVNPGNATAPATLRANQTIWNNNTTFFVNLFNTTVGGFDNLNVTGNITLGNATLAGAGNNSIPVGANLTIIQSTTGVIGRFNNANDTLVTTDGQVYNILYTANSVVLNRPKATVAPSLTGIPNPQELGLAAILNVLVPNTANSTPTGNVTYAINGVAQPGTFALNASGQANITLPSTLALGNHTITANYNGNAVYNAASANMTLTISPMSVSVTANVSPSSPTSSNQALTISGSVIPVRAGFGLPTGTVRLFDGNVTLGNATLSGGSYTFTLPANTLSAGIHNFNVTYLGAGNFTVGSATFSHTITGTTTLNLSLNGTLTFGNNQTLSVTVAGSGNATPTGNVTFLVDGTPIGANVALNGAGQASATLPLAGGNRTLTAVYNGDPVYNAASTSILRTIAAAATNTTISLATPASPQNPGTAITFTANVTPALLGTPPTGNVSFFDGNVSLGNGTITSSNGTATASLTTTALVSAGAHFITARYNGDTNYAASTSASSSFVINLLASTTTLATSNATSFFGQSVVTATVTGAGPTPTGTVTFTANGGAFNQTMPLVGGVAVFNPPLAAGTYTNLTATYNGDAAYSPSVSGTSINQTVSQAVTSTTLASSNPSGLAGAAITATVVNTHAPGVAPTGNVIFTVNGVNTTIALDASGNATLAPPLTPAGSPYTITATFVGNANLTPSVSGSLNQSITAAATTTSLLAVPSSGTYGQNITLSSTVNAAVPVLGNVTFFLNGVAQGTVPVTGGIANLTLPLVNAGNHTIRADYQDGVFFIPSTSGNNTLDIARADTTLTLTASSNTTVIGQPVTFNAQVVNASSTGVLPAGNVTFFINGTPQTSVALVNGNASFTTSNFLIGNQTVEAVFNANTNFTGSNASMTETVLASPIAFANLPGSVVSASPFGLQVRILTGTGTVDASFNGPVTLTIRTGPSGGILRGVNVVNAVAGVATYSNLTLDKAGDYILDAKIASLADPVPSPTITVTANRLGVTVPTVSPNVAFTINVSAYDSTGAVATNANGIANIQMLSGPTGAVFTSAPATMTNGVASLTGLRVSTAGTYKFRITFNGLVYDLTIVTLGKKL